jgi:chromosome partitioning protein
MAKKITVNLHKGGVGKTSTSINLAAALQQKGQRVLLVDLDPQANATLAVGLNPLSLERNLNHLFTDIHLQPHQVIIEAAKTSGGMHVLPSHPDLARTEAGMNASSVGSIRDIITPIEEHYDFIIFDTPPAENFLTLNALVASDLVIIPLQAHFLALQGLEQVFEQIRNVNRGLNPKLKVHGILPTMVNQRTNVSRLVLDQVREKYPELVFPFSIDYSIKHSEASLYGVPLVMLDQFHSSSASYNQLADTLL